MAYTIKSTILLGIVLVFLTYLLYNLFNKLKIKINKKLLIGIFAWVLLAAFTRVFEDANIYPKSFFTVSPGIIILFSAFFIPVVYIGYWLEKNKKIDLWKTLTISAIIPILIHLPFLKIENAQGATIIVAIFGIILIVMYTVNKFIKADDFSFWALGAHMFDASTTFTAMSFYGYSEQHVLPTFMINIFGPYIMFALKLIFLIPMIFVINKYSENDSLRKFLLLAIFAIGLAPALRNTLRLLMGV